MRGTSLFYIAFALVGGAVAVEPEQARALAEAYQVKDYPDAVNKLIQASEERPLPGRAVKSSSEEYPHGTCYLRLRYSYGRSQREKEIMKPCHESREYKEPKTTAPTDTETGDTNPGDARSGLGTGQGAGQSTARKPTRHRAARQRTPCEWPAKGLGDFADCQVTERSRGRRPQHGVKRPETDALSTSAPKKLKETEDAGGDSDSDINDDDWNKLSQSHQELSKALAE